MYCIEFLAEFILRRFIYEGLRMTRGSRKTLRRAQGERFFVSLRGPAIIGTMAISSLLLTFYVLLRSPRGVYPEGVFLRRAQNERFFVSLRGPAIIGTVAISSYY